MSKYWVYYNSKGWGRYEVHTPECSHYKFSQGLHPTMEKMPKEYEAQTSQEVAEEFFNSTGGDCYAVVSPCAKSKKAVTK